jgi:regulator of protease activity HflC (stomatin/prohibitin superfamily)
MLIKKIVPFALAFSALVLWLSTGIVQIESYQQGALYRLGNLESDSLSPGMHLTLPWPLDRVEIYDTETVNEITIGYLATDATDNLWTEAHGNNEYKLLLGGGNELVSINLRIEYKIGDLGRFLKCSSSPAKLLESTAYETVTNKTINTDLDTLLATDRAEFSKSFEKELTKRIAKYNTGIEIVGVVIESIHPPVEVANIYQQIISAGIEAEKIVLDAQAQAGVTVSQAQSEHDRNINIATSESHKQIADAQSAVAEFTASVENDKNYGDGYRYYKYLEAIKKAYSGAKLIIVGDGIDSSSLYLGSVS